MRPDHALCCIAPAMSERSASSPWGHTRKRVVITTGFARLPNKGVGDAKGEGTPDRGSSVSFTRCEVSRSWLDDSTRSLYRQRGALRATGVSDVARALSMTRREENACPSESRDHRSAQRRRETPSAPVLTRQRDRERGNRADQGARLIRGNGQKSVVRIFGSSISLASKGVKRGHRRV